MNRFVGDYINTLSAPGVSRVSAITDALKIEKENLSSVADKLAQVPISYALSIPDENKAGRISPSKNNLAFRDIQNRLNFLYDESNLISLILDSHSNALITDIRSLDGELTALEKALSNYAFLLSDGGSYDYAFMEPFNDERSRDSFGLEASDRAGLSFNALEEAIVNTAEGTLSLVDQLDVGYPLTGSIVASNCAAFIASDTGIANAIDANLFKGWRLSIGTPRAFVDTLKEFIGLYNKTSWTGAQFVVEFTLDVPVPVDTISIAPCTEFPFELTQVKLIPDKSHEDNFTYVMTAPVKVDKAMSVHFPLQTTQRIQLYIRQDTFQLEKAPPINYKHWWATKTFESIQNQWRTDDIVGDIHSSDREDVSLSNPSIDDFTDPWETNVPFYQIYSDEKITNSWWQINLDSPITKELIDNFGNGIMNMIHPGTVSIPATQDEMNRLNYKQFPDPNIQEQPMQVSNANAAALKYGSSIPETEMFVYNLGIQLIKVGLGSRGYKGVFITKPIPAPGDMGEVKIKTGETNFNFLNTDKDNSLATFIEYSVTNKSHPKNESDWVSILPIDDNESINELFLVDDAGLGLLRFPASLGSSIILFKNGYVVDRPLDDLLVKSEDKQTILGLRLPLGFATKEDNLICSYTPALDPHVINFEKAGLGIPPLASAHDENQAGEAHSTTNADLTVDLKYSPFINYSSVDSSSYNSVYGLNPYNPITVTLDDGSAAINLTNYKGGDQTALDPTSSTPQYIHNQNILLFNKAITQPFKVYYQYLPSNVRFRIVLRSIIGSFVSPTVDWVQIKGKTRKPDPKRV